MALKGQQLCFPWRVDSKDWNEGWYEGSEAWPDDGVAGFAVSPGRRAFSFAPPGAQKEEKEEEVQGWRRVFSWTSSCRKVSCSCAGATCRLCGASHEARMTKKSMAHAIGIQRQTILCPEAKRMCALCQDYWEEGEGEGSKSKRRH